jgi:hypothetical protein
MSLPASEFLSFLSFAIPVLGFTLLGRPRRSGWNWDVQDVEDPRVVGVNAPIGTTCRNTLTGDVYVKVGPAATDWQLFATEALFPVQAGLISVDFTVTIGEINQIASTTTPQINADLPAANSVPNGAWAIIAVNPPAASLVVNITPVGTDTINFGIPGALLQFSLVFNNLVTTLVSDGVSNWTEVARINT